MEKRCNYKNNGSDMVLFDKNKVQFGSQEGVSPGAKQKVKIPSLEEIEIGQLAKPKKKDGTVGIYNGLILS